MEATQQAGALPRPQLIVGQPAEAGDSPGGKARARARRSSDRLDRYSDSRTHSIGWATAGAKAPTRHRRLCCRYRRTQWPLGAIYTVTGEGFNPREIVFVNQSHPNCCPAYNVFGKRCGRVEWTRPTGYPGTYMIKSMGNVADLRSAVIRGGDQSSSSHGLIFRPRVFIDRVFGAVYEVVPLRPCICAESVWVCNAVAQPSSERRSKTHTLCGKAALAVPDRFEELASLRRTARLGCLQSCDRRAFRVV